MSACVHTLRKKKKKKKLKGLIARSRVVISEGGLGSGLFGSSLSLQPWRFALCVCVCVFPLLGLSSALYQSHYEIVCVLANPVSGARLFTVDQPLPGIP